MFNINKEVNTSTEVTQTKTIIGIDKCKILSMKVEDKTDAENNPYKALAIWLKSDQGGSVNYSVKISSKERISATGKFQWIDMFGNTAWAKTADEIKTSFPYKDKDGKEQIFETGFDLKSARKANIGEEDFTNFFRKLFNLPKGQPTFADNKDFEKAKLFNSLVKEETIKKIMDYIKASEMGVYALFTVYSKTDGSKTNRVLPTFVNSLMPLVVAQKSFETYINKKEKEADKAEAEGRQGYRISDDYTTDEAVEYKENALSYSVPTTPLETVTDDLPF